MAKELIVSVNGREKKIAIVENERVTEFYIERGEDNQGIVGNIYKGRVMRVLPGMQSAFVDIGLERDAFLYVSDFFDEEEEFERIVVDKTKAGGADRAEAERVATERIEQQRLEREQRIEATQERVEPLAEISRPAAPIPDDEAVRDFQTELEALPGEDEAAPVALQGAETAQEETEEVEQGGKRRGRRGRKRGKGQEQASEARPEQAAGIASAAPESFDIQTPFVAADTSFERVVDEDETIAAENGAMFKDARLQERIFDQIHAVEFDMEDVPEAEVGSILPQTSSRNSFQRIDDSDIAPASEATAPVRETVAAHVDAFVDEVTEETLGAQSFERVSDDEVPFEAQASGEAVEVKTQRGKRKGAASTTKKKKSVEAVGTAAAGEAAKPKRASKKPEGAKKGASKKAASGSKASSTKGRKSKSAANDEGANSNAVSESLQDSEASVTSGRGRAEFATRRGGRRRRRPGKQEGTSGDERVNGKDHDAKPATEVEEVVVEERIAAPPPPPPPRARAER
ncbi:MAG: hypothetical protein WBP93_04360, partial [Pyrinomonadaceae bacterium]